MITPFFQLLFALSLTGGRRPEFFTGKRYICIPALLSFPLFFCFQVGYASSDAVTTQQVYQIGSRDVLSISIFAGGEEQQKVETTVSRTGSIQAPFIGIFTAQGLTIPELEEALCRKLTGRFFISPEVYVNVREYHSIRYYIAGAVTSPGMYEMPNHLSLMQLIARAGGTLAGRGNTAFIVNRGANSIKHNLEKGGDAEDIEQFIDQNSPQHIALSELLDRGNMNLDIMLASETLVYIPLEKSQDMAGSKIYVGGKVKKPGLYRFQPGMTALKACLLAQGFDKFAAPNRARIIRQEANKQVIIKINLNKVKKGKVEDCVLKPGDRIHIPATWL